MPCALLYDGINKSTATHHFNILRDAGLTERLVVDGHTHQRLTASATMQIRTETATRHEKVLGASASTLGRARPARRGQQLDVSSTWGGQITQKASSRWSSSSLCVGLHRHSLRAIHGGRALAALVFDVVTTAGVYSLVGFEVTPATVSVC